MWTYFVSGESRPQGDLTVARTTWEKMVGTNRDQAAHQISASARVPPPFEIVSHPARGITFEDYPSAAYE